MLNIVTQLIQFRKDIWVKCLRTERLESRRQRVLGTLHLNFSGCVDLLGVGILFLVGVFGMCSRALVSRVLCL